MADITGIRLLVDDMKVPDYGDLLVGKDVVPTGHLRMISDGSTARLQSLWRGRFTGDDFWVDVPVVFVDKLPPRGEG